MTPEERNLLNRIAEMVDENNSMLRSMRNSMRISRFFNIFYWVVIIGSALGAYYYLQPYIDNMMGIYSSTQSDLQGAKELLESLKR